MQPAKDGPSTSAYDGKLSLEIENFSDLNETVRGPLVCVGNVNWRIMITPRKHKVQAKGTQKCVGFFLECCPGSAATNADWSCEASAALCMISQDEGDDVVRKVKHVFTPKKTDWGYSCFLTWMEVSDEKYGFIKDGTVIVDVLVKVEQTTNIDVTPKQDCNEEEGWVKAELEAEIKELKSLELN